MGIAEQAPKTVNTTPIAPPKGEKTNLNRKATPSPSTTQENGVKETWSESEQKYVKHTINAEKAYKLGGQYGKEFCKCYLQLQNIMTCEKDIVTKMDKHKRDNDEKIYKYMNMEYEAHKKDCTGLN